MAMAEPLSPTFCQPSRRLPLASPAGLLRLWRDRIRDRRGFPNLDERDLRDMGLSRWDIDRERAKPFWRG
jgi:uncharacterized protein YjiS (DUF1127 family)